MCKCIVPLTAIIITAAASASASTIVSLTGTPSGISYTVDVFDTLAISWTQTLSFGGVIVSAELQGSGTGNAYLMTAIGPGTTSASQIASVPFTFPGSATYLTLFSGLSLGPGTYYLLLSGDTGTQRSGWSIPFSPTYTTGPGVTRMIGYNYTSQPPVAYPPAAVFTNYPFDNDGGAIYTVTGTLVAAPEPGLRALVGLVLGLMLLRMRRKPNERVRSFTGCLGSLTTI
jgi:hypothetical protein